MIEDSMGESAGRKMVWNRQSVGGDGIRREKKGM
jgi:hypothetical protein